MLRRTCLDLHMQIEVWEGTHKTNFEKFVGTGNLLDAGTHDAITREGGGGGVGGDRRADTCAMAWGGGGGARRQWVLSR